ncbi:hypothetical protein N658DRAFT_435038 [Parathielavia hyrcaniae]|uniref:MARVEL domain-containing protein n=1 Tax=Parathielavia hyrcaniae TaxID=113614 RepID=A0AAN6PX32_9PEZI|nr:hypothetical protein N658DRAFT_435038 [Parathielavia hyrcaniae]
MARGETRARTGLSTFLLASSALVWVSSVIMMGILAYLVSIGYRGDHIIYELVISVLTTLFFPLAYFIRLYPGHILLFNLIFSYLWIVAVSFAASDWIGPHGSPSAMFAAVVAFTFIAFFFLFFNVMHDWHYGFYRGGAHSRPVV